MESPRYRVVLCRGTDCSDRSSEGTRKRFREELDRRGLAERVALFETACFGQCPFGPNVVIGPRLADPDPLFGEAQYYGELPGETFYSGVTEDKAVVLVEEHLVGGRIVTELLWEKVAGDH